MSKPNEVQRLLLQAVIGRGASAVQAWHEWDAVTDPEGLDPDSQWLLPALGRNLRRLGVPEDRLWRYENVYRHNWYKNHLALHRAAGAIGELRTRGRVVILGGAAMAIGYYETIGERPFEGVEVVHGPAADAALIGRSDPLAWRSLRAYSLQPVDQLVDICARREAWDARSDLLWIVDVAAVMRRHPAIGWPQVESTAEALGRGDAIGAARRELEAAALEGAVG